MTGTVRGDGFPGYGLFTIGTGALRATVSPLGATLVSLQFHGRELVLGYDCGDAYLAGQDYVGAVVGRYANRIGGASFCLDGQRFRLDANEHGNTLHGGSNGFSKRVFTVEKATEMALTLRMEDEDGSNGFPGTMLATVTYRAEGDALTVTFWGRSTRDTVYGPTSHAYFCLNDSRDCRDTRLFIRADRYLSVDDALLPKEMLPTEDRFGFTDLRRIDGDYDHCFVLENGPADAPAMVTEGDGIRMELFTDYPAIQLYTGQGLHAPLRPYQGFAAEPEFLPDSPNHPEYPSCVLRAGEEFHKCIRYRFSRTEEG